MATGLERYFPQIDLWPDPAILGALDMGYNLGPNFPPKWPAFTAAAQAKDWATCAVQSHRAPPISNERNSYVFNLFTQAAQGMPST